MTAQTNHSPDSGGEAGNSMTKSNQSNMKLKMFIILMLAYYAR